jgi:hypothetical protein
MDIRGVWEEYLKLGGTCWRLKGMGITPRRRMGLGLYSIRDDGFTSIWRPFDQNNIYTSRYWHNVAELGKVRLSKAALVVTKWKDNSWSKILPSTVLISKAKFFSPTNSTKAWPTTCRHSQLLSECIAKCIEAIKR